MSDPLSLTVRDAVIDALNEPAGSGDVPVATKRRVMPGEPIKEPFIAVFLDDENVNLPQGTRGAIAARDVGINIQIGVATADLSTVDDLLEPLRAHVIERLGDTDLDGLATSVIEVGIPEGGRIAYKLDLYNALVFSYWRVRYQTKRADLSAKQ
jgi:hypothetical protein